VNASFRLFALVLIGSASVLRAQTGSAAAAPGNAATKGPAPIKQFEFPIFGENYVRTGFIKGDDVQYVSETQFDVGGMNLSAYAKNAPGRVETVLIAPAASVFVKDNNVIVRGDKSMRIVRDDLDASGQKWSYDHNRKVVVIDGSVHVIIRAELKDILK
jgi:hypothetical protein